MRPRAFMPTATLISLAVLGGTAVVAPPAQAQTLRVGITSDHSYLRHLRANIAHHRARTVPVLRTAPVAPAPLVKTEAPAAVTTVTSVPVVAADAAAAVTPVVPAIVTPAKVPASGAVFGAQFHGLWSSYSDAQRNTVLSTMAANGVRSVRIDLSWAMLQPTGPDSYDTWGVGFCDKVIGQAVAHGLEPIVTLWMTPGWANGGAGYHALPSNPADYARAAQWAAARWAGKVSAWEVWNEPNSAAFMVGANAAAYAGLLRAAYPAFHAGDPATKVVFGGTEYVDVEWIGAALAAGATHSFDVMGVHPYMGISDASPNTPDDGTKWTLKHVAVLHDLLVKSGRSEAPIYFTEFGWSALNTAADAPNWKRGVSPTTQATYLQQTIQLVRTTMPYVTHMFWYEDLVGIEDGFNGGFGLVRPDGTATPALEAVASA